MTIAAGDREDEVTARATVSARRIASGVMIPPVVDVEWLHANRERVHLADARWYLDGRSGPDAYAAGHLPGAVFVDLDRWLAGPATAADGRHPLPDPTVFARGMAALGIGDGDVVVAYDDAGGVIAARLVWMLRATGQDAALLDGGLHGFDAPLEIGPGPTPQPATFTARPWPAARLVTIDEITDEITDETIDKTGGAATVVIDARQRERFRGDPDPVDARSGHIPGAVSVPCRENLTDEGHFVPVDQLRATFAAAGIDDAAAVVSYCGSGVTACHNLLALEHAGLGLGRLYPGSWSQYAATDRPIESGD